jgi:hypothetical protein
MGKSVQFGGEWDKEMLGGKEVYQWAGASFETYSACCEFGGAFGGEGYNWGTTYGLICCRLYSNMEIGV